MFATAANTSAITGAEAYKKADGTYIAGRLSEAEVTWRGIVCSMERNWDEKSNSMPRILGAALEAVSAPTNNENSFAEILTKRNVADDPGSNPDQKYARRRERQSTFGRIK
jgi:hypothetical protein